MEGARRRQKPLWAGWAGGRAGADVPGAKVVGDGVLSRQAARVRALKPGYWEEAERGEKERKPF